VSAGGGATADATCTPAWRLSGFGDEIDPDPRVQAAVLRGLGASFVEVRAAWGVNVLELGPARLAELAAVLAEAGVGVSAIASPIGKSELDRPVGFELGRLEAALAAARTLGTRHVRVFSFQNADRPPAAARDEVVARMSALARRAAADGVVLVHENEVGVWGDVPGRIAELMSAVDSPSLRVAWDAGNFVRVGLRPFDDAYALLRPWLAYLQVKDAVRGGGSVAAGEGDGQVAQTVAALVASGFDGFVSMEPHLASAGRLGGFSGPAEFGRATRAFARIVQEQGGRLA
jgi:sugar phosphate isomerase/epimerase